MYATTQRTKNGFVPNHWAALVVVAGASLFACADSARDTTMTATGSGAQLAPAATMTPAQLLGVHHALSMAANMEASVVYGASDPRIADLANRITDARIAQEAEANRIAAILGITLVETPLSLQIAAQSSRDVAALRAAGTNADDIYINGLVLTEARALGLTDHLLLPNAATDELVAAFVNRARSEWITQLGEAQKIQRARNDWRFNTKIPAPLLEAPPPQLP